MEATRRLQDGSPPKPTAGRQQSTGRRKRHPDALRQIEEDILEETGNKREKVVALGPSGELLFTRTGEVGDVGFTPGEMDQLRGRVEVLLHNHPSEGGIGTADFDIAVDLNVRELRAFGRRYRYRLIRPGGAWPPLQPVLAELAQIRASVRHYLSAQVVTGKLTPAAYSLRYWHEVWTRYTKQHPEVIYVRETR